MDEIIRKECVLDNTFSNLEELYTLKKFPVSMSCVPLDFKNIDYKYMDMTFEICKNTGIIQLKNVPNLNDIYITPHNSSYGDIWDKLFEIFNKLLYDNIKEIHNLKIIEIGGGSLKLASKILNINHNIEKYIVYEKNISIKYVDDERLNIIDEYFLKDTKVIDDVDIIIHSHVLEHVWNPVEFIEAITKNININKYHCFIVPNLQKTYENKYTNALNFEHNFFITEPYIDVILNNNSFEIIKKYYYLDHSIIYITKKKSIFNELKLFPNMYFEYKQLGLNFYNYHTDLIKEMNEKMKNYDGQVYLYGAHIFSQYLIAFGLNMEKIVGILDNSVEKNKKKLYGTNLVVEFPSIIQNNNKVCVILKAASYQNEIKEQLRILNNNIFILE